VENLYAWPTPLHAAMRMSGPIQRTLESRKPERIWLLRIMGDRMEETLTLADKTVFRMIASGSCRRFNDLGRQTPERLSNPAAIGC
jgi:hypothetical protein